MVSGGILATDCVDFYADDFGWKENRWFHTGDLARDDIANKNVRLARRTQRKVPTRQRPLTERQDLSLVKGRLQLRQQNGQISLEMSFPQLEQAAMEPLRRALRRRRYAPRLWGVSARVPSEQLLSGLPFSLKITSQPDEDAELLPGLSDLEIDDAQREQLRAFRMNFRPPVLFAVSADGEVARDVRGVEISGHRKYWLLAPPDVFIEHDTLPTLGEVGPYSCIELNPSIPAAADSLQELGYRVRFGLDISFAGDPSFDRTAAILQFATGDTRLLVPRRLPPVGSLVKLGEEEVPLGDDLIKISIQEGDHILTVSSQEESRTFRFHGTKKITTRQHRVCWLELIAPELTVQALLDGSVSLRIDSLVPLEGLELTLELEVAGRLISVVSTTLGPLPEIIAGDADIWLGLLDESTRQLALQGNNLTLHARVGALTYDSWPLDRRVSPCWWEYTGTEVSLRSELGVMEYGGVKASHLFESPDSSITDDDDDAVLLVPIGIDRSKYGLSAEFTTLCIAPSRINLDTPFIRKPRLRRTLKTGRGSSGLEDLMVAYLRWSLAESTTVTGELRRRQVTMQLDNWVSELCCGEVWARREVDLGLTTSDPWQLLVKMCSSTGLGKDPYIELTPGDESTVTQLAVAEIRRTRPELWTLVGKPCYLDPEDYEALDLACGRAYVKLAEEYIQRGDEDLAAEIAEGDPGADGEEWNEVLEGVKAQAELHTLAELLIPSDTPSKFVKLDFAMMSLDDLTEEFYRWSRGAQHSLAGGAPDVTILETILTLWLAPARAVNLDWRGALNTLLAERCLARTARYICLRSRTGGGGI